MTYHMSRVHQSWYSTDVIDQSGTLLPKLILNGKRFSIDQYNYEYSMYSIFTNQLIYVRNIFRNLEYTNNPIIAAIHYCICWKITLGVGYTSSALIVYQS